MPRRICLFWSCWMYSTSSSSMQVKTPVEFDHDCREGICGSCGVMINGQAHGGPTPNGDLPAIPAAFSGWRRNYCGTLAGGGHFRSLKTWWWIGRLLTALSWRGGYVSVKTGSAPDANAIPIPKPDADLAFDYATCIGCGACVAACPNASASLFTAGQGFPPVPVTPGASGTQTAGCRP